MSSDPNRSKNTRVSTINWNKYCAPSELVPITHLPTGVANNKHFQKQTSKRWYANNQARLIKLQIALNWPPPRHWLRIISINIRRSAIECAYYTVLLRANFWFCCCVWCCEMCKQRARRTHTCGNKSRVYLRGCKTNNTLWWNHFK
jgi:hypothetical protein